MATITVAATGMLYPLLVYAARETVAPAGFVAVAVGLIGLRLVLSGGAAARVWRVPLLAAAGAMAALLPLDPWLAARAYPVVLSLGFAAAFAVTLRHPPSLIERLARLREPDLPPEGQAYCRTVTWVWAVWLTVNAAVATALAVAGSDAAWALWTGLLSYVAMGVLFAGEWLVRRRVRGAAR
ncbi:hypothetical protein [Azospirillum sp. TSO35-2]|uniref:hypothetical protein n=1 Tax=Azospirillum sp. TSO35-2 TaxID=716796 RepID=UPI000D60E3DB|nr:hypothetical protein [Azospirillum sp. TSO35-2]PWC35978.1 hypothetical protein TSO352_12360 [Azospirillum sp. TSO35-2]